MKILVTGCAGFIGMHVSLRLAAQGNSVVGVDNLSDYYDVALKQARLAHVQSQANFHFEKLDISERGALNELFAKERFDRVVHLAAQPGVRYSLKNPHAYVMSNLVGFANVLESSRQHNIAHLVFASSSSVYGGNTRMPFSEEDNVDHPVSFYAATKKSNELMAHSYSHLFRLPITGLRFFTVYGPWGRPDMSPSLFTRAILEGKPIDIFNHGEMQRDFTYIDDIVEGVVRILDKPASPNPRFNTDQPDPATSNAPYRLYNIGHHQPVKLMTFIEILEAALGKKAKKNFLPMQPGDMLATYANIHYLHDAVGFTPTTLLSEGIKHFVTWFKDYYGWRK